MSSSRMTGVRLAFGHSYQAGPGADPPDLSLRTLQEDFEIDRVRPHRAPARRIRMLSQCRNYFAWRQARRDRTKIRADPLCRQRADTVVPEQGERSGGRRPAHRGDRSAVVIRQSHAAFAGKAPARGTVMNRRPRAKSLQIEA